MATTRPALMSVEIWSDVVCPWCYIGKRRFETAMAQFEHRSDVAVTWRSFELDPGGSSPAGMDLVARLATKYGVTREQAEAMNARVTTTAAEVGLGFRLDLARPGNTFDAHRLLHMAASHGLQDALKERLLAAYFIEGESIGDAGVLVRLAAEVGLPAPATRDVLGGDEHADAVRADESTAGVLGITGVPFFVIDRSFGISGAQPVEVLVGALRRAWAETHPLVSVGAPGGDSLCTDEVCAV